MSEFQRITPQGEVAPPDRQESYREILSPAVARNAFASFRIVVTAPPGENYTLYAGQNPENFFRITVYRERCADPKPGCIPEQLQEAGDPAVGRMAPGEKVHTYWMDIWVDATAAVQRVKVEPQLNYGDGWVIYPMEVRVVPAIVAGAASTGGPLPDASAAADSAARGPLVEQICPTAAVPSPPRSPTVRSFIRRNAQQDMALARAREKEHSRAEVIQKLLAPVGAADAAKWCGEKVFPPGPEWYLRLRDVLVRGW